MQVSGNLLDKIGALYLTSSKYVVYLITVPAGTPADDLFSNYHLWASSLDLYLLADMETRVLQLFSGQAEAGAAILYALDRGEDLEDVASAILSGTLSQYGTFSCFSSLNRATPPSPLKWIRVR